MAVKQLEYNNGQTDFPPPPFFRKGIHSEAFRMLHLHSMKDSKKIYVIPVDPLVTGNKCRHICWDTLQWFSLLRIAMCFIAKGKMLQHVYQGFCQCSSYMMIVCIYIFGFALPPSRMLGVVFWLLHPCWIWIEILYSTYLTNLTPGFMASTKSHINSTMARLSSGSLLWRPESFKTSGLAITANTMGGLRGLPGGT